MSVRKFDFTGGVAMVTGSATGIGHATAVAFAREGADLVLVDTHKELGVSAIQEAFTAESTEANWNRVINVNLKGVWLCMKYQMLQASMAY